jgi:4-hydroxy-3-methylbut-2-enyl diphosphate reductase
VTATVCVPLAVERLALRGALRGCRVIGTGMGARRARAAAERAGLAGTALIVAGVAGGLDPRLRPGDLVVASEVRAAGGAVTPVPSAPLLAGALRRLGLPVHLGPVVCTPTVCGGAELARLAATGAVAVEMEAAALAEVAAGAPFAVVRAVLDTPAHPLLRPGTPVRTLRALRSLRRAAPAIRAWTVAAWPDPGRSRCARPGAADEGVGFTLPREVS